MLSFFINLIQALSLLLGILSYCVMILSLPLLPPHGAAELYKV